MTKPVLATNPSAFRRFVDIEGEQQFTNAFFGLLEIADLDVINSIFGDYIQFRSRPSITLDTTVDLRRPDALLAADGQVLMVEVKTGADESGDGQLEEELSDLRKEFDHVQERCLLYLTHTPAQPTEARHLSAENLDFNWTNWYEIDTLLQHSLEEVTGANRRLLQLLHKLLEIKGYKGYTGMNPADIQKLKDSFDAYEAILEDFQALTMSVIQEADHTIEAQISKPKFWQDLKERKPVIHPGYVLAAFRTPSFKRGEEGKAKRTQSFAYLLLDEREGLIKAGISLRLGDNKNYKFTKELIGGSSLADIIDYLDADITVSSDSGRKGVAIGRPVESIDKIGPASKRVNISVSYSIEDGGEELPHEISEVIAQLIEAIPQH